ncbi:MAG: hypothetical protein AAFQ89_18215 [Cyanobacteria bacterium J06626_18]
MDGLVQQRLHHILDSYSLVGEAGETFAMKLVSLTKGYPWFIVELALTEVLVQNWLRYPLPRGVLFLEQVEERLQVWQKTSRVSSCLTPDQFELITGLSPLCFDALNMPSGYPDKPRMLAVESGLGDRSYTTN